MRIAKDFKYVLTLKEVILNETLRLKLIVKP